MYVTRDVHLRHQRLTINFVAQPFAMSISFPEQLVKCQLCWRITLAVFALIFIAFDVEAAFLFPVLTAYKEVASFAALFEESLTRQEMRVGEVITAEVVSVDQNIVVVNAGLKSESIIPVEEFKNDKGELEVKVGDFVTVAIEALEDGYGATKLSREKVAEISRVAVMGEFRRRKGEGGQEAPVADQDFGDDKQPRFPYIPISLYFAAVQMAQRAGIEYLFTLTEPRLAQHFGKLGVNVITIGEAVEHRGLRVPSMLMANEIYGSLRSLVRPLWHAVEEQMAPVYARRAATS